MITAKNLKLTLKNKNILNNVSVSLPKGSITTFIGKSGAGKTSLLKCLSQLYQNYEGEILFKEQQIKQLTAQQRVNAIGFVFQQFHLFPHLTVLQNCIQPQMTALGSSWKSAEIKALHWLEMLDLLEKKDSYPNKLSGGQQQRVAIARALVLEPQAILFDEPSASLDPQNTKSLAILLKELNKKGITIGLCSHDVPFIKELLDHVYFLDEGSVVDEYHSSSGQLNTASPIRQFLSV